MRGTDYVELLDQSFKVYQDTQHLNLEVPHIDVNKIMPRFDVIGRWLGAEEAES